ncbi:MAG: hypothetical protein ACQCXQ_13765 [Verrucomicrobiales bacterium]|nr:hypothetical protein [Verrucomicrobiota bacterium JB025]
MKFVPKDKGDSAENSNGGGTKGFIEEALLMIVANLGIIQGMSILVILILMIAGILIGLGAWLFGS